MTGHLEEFFLSMTLCPLLVEANSQFQLRSGAEARLKPPPPSASARKKTARAFKIKRPCGGAAGGFKWKLEFVRRRFNVSG